MQYSLFLNLGLLNFLDSKMERQGWLGVDYNKSQGPPIGLGTGVFCCKDLTVPNEQFYFQMVVVFTILVLLSRMLFLSTGIEWLQKQEVPYRK
jgi:hypothetical protein